MIFSALESQREVALQCAGTDRQTDNMRGSKCLPVHFQGNSDRYIPSSIYKYYFFQISTVIKPDTSEKQRQTHKNTPLCTTIAS